MIGDLCVPITAANSVRLCPFFNKADIWYLCARISWLKLKSTPFTWRFWEAYPTLLASFNHQSCTCDLNLRYYNGWFLLIRSHLKSLPPGNNYILGCFFSLPVPKIYLGGRRCFFSFHLHPNFLRKKTSRSRSRMLSYMFRGHLPNGICDLQLMKFDHKNWLGISRHQVNSRLGLEGYDDWLCEGLNQCAR